MRTPFLILCVVVSCAGHLPAQAPAPSPAEKPTPPSGPLIQKRAPNFARWTLTAKVAIGKTPAKPDATPAGSPAAPGVATETVSVTKTGAIVHVVRVDPQGKTWETWCRGPVQVALGPGSSQPALVAAPPGRDSINPLFFDFGSSDFQGFDWISDKNFTGIKPVLGKNCLVFRDERKVTGPLAPTASPAPGSSPGAPAPAVSSQVVACVDVDSRLPVALSNENGTVTYQFQDAPAAMQELPANISAAMDKQKTDAQNTRRKPNTPY